MEISARVNVRLGKTYPVEEKVFGHFIEHLGRCIRNGIWDEREDLPCPVEFGAVRRDVFEAMKELRPPVIRWPGGCFADTYKWKDGVGPQEERRRRLNLSWWWLRPPETVFEDNHFGTDEFIELCRRLGAEPYINVSFGAGTAEEAREWVEYCNGNTDTPGGALRAENGSEEPHNVKYWGIANEIWGAYELGFCPTGGIYSWKYLKFYNAMKSADMSIKAVAVGANNTYPRWNRRFLRRAAHAVDYLSLHEYVPGVNPVLSAMYTGYPDTEEAYYTMLAGADMFRDSIEWFRDTIVASAGPETDIKIAFDEWNAWWKHRQIFRAEDYTMRDGLMVAATLSHLVKLSPIVGMANFAQFVNTVGLVITHSDGLYKTPSWYAFKMYRDGTLDEVVETEVGCDGIPVEGMGRITGRENMPFVEALATRKMRGGEVSLLLINKHIAEPVSVKVSFTGAQGLKRSSLIRRMVSDSPFDGNSMEEPERVKIIEEKVKAGVDTITLPPHSVTQVSFRRPAPVKKKQKKKVKKKAKK